MVKQPVHPDLIEKIAEYCEQHDVPVSRFGVMAINDPNLVRDLNTGRELRRSTERLILERLAMPPEPKAAGDEAR